MCWMVQQREEREDARLMDAARLASEEMKQQEDAKKKTAAMTFSYTTLKELKDKFSKSWILNNLTADWMVSSIQDENHKKHWVKLLELESLSQKWYQNKLPSYYFLKEVCPRGESKTNIGEVKNWLIWEYERLQAGLYKLEEQQGGAPKIFTKAQDKFASNENDDDNDGDVICVGRRTVQVNGGSSSGVSPSKKSSSGSPNKNGKQGKRDSSSSDVVIEDFIEVE